MPNYDEWHRIIHMHTHIHTHTHAEQPHVCSRMCVEQRLRTKIKRERFGVVVMDLVSACASGIKRPLDAFYASVYSSFICHVAPEYNTHFGSIKYVHVF